MKNRILSLVLAVMCMITTIPFTSFAVGAAEVEYTFRILDANDISEFEDSWTSQGTYTISGVNVVDTVFYGQSVKAYSKTGDKIIATRDDLTKDDYHLNLYSYDEEKDSSGKVVRMYDAQYVAVEYYYDTTERDTSDRFGSDLAGNVMRFTANSYYENGTKKYIDTSKAEACESTEPIVENQWATAVFNLKDAVNSPELFAYNDADTYTMGQWMLYLFGYNAGQQMFKGDVFYVKNISFCSYDPSNPPNEDREVIFYLTQNDYVEDVLEQGRFLKLEGVKDLDTIIIPNPEDDEYGFDSMDGQRFSHWVRIDYGTKHYPGEEFIIDGNDTYFCGVYTKPQSIRFNYTGGVGKFDLDNCFRGDTIIMPDFPEDADIEYYGWKDNITGKVYKPGGEYVYSDIRVGFNAYIPQEFYYSTSGSIDGISDKVYTTFEELDAAIANEGGIGTIFVAGNLDFPEGTYTFSSSDVKFVGYDSDATVTLNKDGNVTFESTSNTKLTFDDIRIVRGQGSKDENWLQLRNVDLVFGSNCDFETAIFNDWKGNPAERGLYIANGNNFTVEIGGEVIVECLSPLGGWSDYGHTAVDNYKYTINGGTVNNLYLVANNGNWSAQPSTITGNVDVEINGGNITNLYLGSNRADMLDGNATVTVNGGNISNINYGNADTYSSASTGNVNNVALIYNVKDILDGGYKVPSITKTDKTNEVQNSVVIVNNAELASNIPELDAADYNIQVKGGKATPVFVADSDKVYFSIEFDADFDYEVLANGKVIHEYEDGLYALDKGTTVVEYRDVSPSLISFDYGTDVLQRVSFKGETITLPELPEDAVIPDDNVFKGWRAGDVVYAAGSEYFFTGEHFEFTAEFVEIAKVYYSSTGSINGISENVYKTLSEADAALALQGGIGIISVYGNLELSHTAEYQTQTYRFESTSVKITGYDSNATVTFNKTGNVAFDSSSRTKITFDDIRIVRGQGKNGENWLRLNNIDLIFGDTCEWSGSLGLYIANEAGFYNSTVQIGGKVIVDNLAPLGAWIEGSHIATDDYKFVINGGAVKSIYLVANNGNDSGIPSVITGNVDVEINGGDIDALFLGSRRSDKLDGNAIVTINGGNIKNLYYGNDWTNSQENGNIKNLALVYNVKEILDGGYNVSPIAKREKTNDVKNAVVIVNNSELADTIPSLGVATYSVQVNGGKATPVFDGENVLFDIAIDSTDEEGALYANGKAIKANEDGLYILDKGTTVIKYSAVPPQTVTFTYGDKYFEQLWLEGDTVMLPKLPADAVIPEDKEFKGWNAGGVVYAEGYSYEFDGTVLEFTAEFVKAEEKILYLNPQSGNDANDGFSANTAIKTLDEVTERLSAFTSGKATLEIVGTLTDNKIYLPEYSGVLTIQGGTIKWGDGLYLSGNTVFKNVELYATADWKHINTNGHDMTFDTGVTKAANSENLNIHAGVENSDMNGDNKIVLKSGDITDFRIGPYYIPGNHENINTMWTGNFELIVDGANISEIANGDGWNYYDSVYEGSFCVTGSEKIIIKSGSVDKINTNKLHKITGGIQVFDYCDHNFDFNNRDTYNIAIHRFDIYGDIEATFENGKFITDNVVRVKGSNTDLQGMTEFTGLEAGTYSVYPREISFAGAQIRLDDPAALRFIFKVNGASSAAKANYGMLVYPTALLGDDVLTHDLVGEGKAKDIEVNKIFAEDSTSFSFSVAIYNIKNTASGYQKEFTVVPYIVEADGSYTYCEAQNCSLYDVAKEATGTDAQNEFIKNIISTVEGSEN